MANLWQTNNNTTINLQERVRLDPGDLPLAVFPNSEITVIAGELPPGLRIESTDIVGTPFEVAQTTEYKVVLRAKYFEDIQDRTFKFYVSGADDPIWVTNEDLLPVGTGESYFILDNEFIDFQLIAVDPDVSAGQRLEYYIKPGEGVLPDGIELTRDGRIVGVVEPLLALDKRAESGGWDTSPYDLYPNDFSIRSDNGWDSFFYDTFRFDFAYKSQTPKKLNRYYQFRVTVNDGFSENTPQRVFRIYVVGDDYLRSDNTIMKVGNGVFRADNTNIRQPKWLTPRDLGFKRANNNVTIYLEVYDNETLDGKVVYSLDDINDDGSPSRLPPGTKLDSISGEITGLLPYQPTVTEEYKFTIRATRYTLDTDIAFVTATIYEDTLSGKRSFKVFKLPLNEQDGVTLNDGIDDLAILRGQTIVLEGRPYIIDSVDGSNEDFDTITLREKLLPKISVTLSRTTFSEAPYLYVNKVNYLIQEQFIGKTLKFSETEQYQVKSFQNYVHWNIHSDSGNIDINLAAADTEPLGFGLAATETIQSKILRMFSRNGAVPVLFPEPLPQEEGGTAPPNLTVKDISILVPNTALTTSSRIREIFRPNVASLNDLVYTKVSDSEDLLQLEQPLRLGREIESGTEVGLGLFKDDFFEKQFTFNSNEDITDPATPKTFTIKLLGDVESKIVWVTPPDLGSINANFISTLRVVAGTTLPEAKLVYTLESGSLPNGLTLAYNGEIIGKVAQFGTPEEPGLTTIDNAAFLLDGGSTTIDRTKTFTVKAADRFGYSAQERTFTVKIVDEDATLYSNLYMRPFLQQNIRDDYRRFVSDANIFPPSAIYRAADSNFGIKTQPEILAYAGIETNTIDEFVAAAAKNHRRKQFRMGEVKRAVAKEPGTNNIVYEVVYIEVVDPQDSDKGKVANNIVSKSKPKLTVDSVAYEVRDDSTGQDTGVDTITVQGRARPTEVIVDQPDAFTIRTRDGLVLQQFDNDDVDVFLRDETEVNIPVNISDSEPLRRRFRDKYANNVKADTDAIIINNAAQLNYYISNITNMRERLEEVGKSESKFLPLWMRTGQDDAIQELGYVPAIPLAYCKPGKSREVLLNVQNALKQNTFDFKNVNLDIDRYIIDSATDVSQPSYIIFQNYIFNV